jgi:hypothetical protein
MLTACIPEAPHDNPMDPYLSKSDKDLKFSGMVYSQYQPYEPIENVKISVEDVGKYVYSNSSGLFEIEGLQENSYTFILQKANYKTDTLDISVNKQNLQQDFHLNALPQLSSIRYYSKKINTIFSAEPLITADIDIEVTDADGPGDIDSAQVVIDAFSFQANLKSVLPAGSFHISINEQDINTQNIHDLVEKPLWLNLTDKAGATNRVGPFYISRFIESSPQAISPAEQETVTQPLLFVWQEVQLPYNFTFEINIFKYQSGLSQLVFNQSGINPKATYLNYNSLLDNGIYYWTITIVDAHNNTSESKEAVFQIR